MPRGGVASTRDRVLGVVWCVSAFLLVGALVLGAVQVLSDWSAEQGYRWVMALFFLGGSFAWFTSYSRDSLHRFFDRP